MRIKNVKRFRGLACLAVWLALVLFFPIGVKAGEPEDTSEQPLPENQQELFSQLTKASGADRLPESSLFRHWEGFWGRCCSAP